MRRNKSNLSHSADRFGEFSGILVQSPVNHCHRGSGVLWEFHQRPFPVLDLLDLGLRRHD